MRTKRVRPPVRILSALVLLVGSVGPAWGLEHNWYAEHQNPDAIGFDITALYEALHARRLLPVRAYVDQEGKPISRIMREQKHFVGQSFPLALDRLLCDLNPPVCRAVSAPETKATRFVWSGKAGTPYRLPDIVFERYQTAVDYAKPRGERVPDIVVRKLQGCLTFDVACRRAVLNLNPRLKDPLDPAYEGMLVLPSIGVKAAVPGLERLEQEPTTAAPERPVSQTSEWQLRGLSRAAEPLGPRDNKLGIQKNIPDQTRYRLQGNPINDFFYQQHQDRLFRLIKHPLLDQPLDPEQYRNRVVVAVLDGWVDPHHCDFKGAAGTLIVENRQPGPPAAPGTGDCSRIEQRPTLEANHGTHVTGIIGARLNERGLVGVNPLAHLVTIEANDLPPIDLAGAIHRAITVHGARVINLSLSRITAAAGNDPVGLRIRRHTDVLFVVAAGNDAKSSDDMCVSFPACYPYPNVLAVVALNGDATAPDVWAEVDRGSNYGLRFHVAAPGAHILSTISEGRYGYFSGTSQAAPLVTGAASLLLMKNAALSAERIRERLIVTSDLFETLAEKVRGGRLNIRRALDFEEDVIVQPTGSLRGRLVRSGALPVIRPSGSRVDIPWGEVRRVVATGESGLAVLRVTERDGRREIERLSNMRVADPNASVDIVVSGEATRMTRVPLGQIMDFTARLED